MRFPRFYTQADADREARLQHERDAAFESAQRFAEANLKLASDIVRLADRVAPSVPEGEIAQPKATREIDKERVTKTVGERDVRPEPGPVRLE